jgi:hypothetical protein
MRLKEGEERLNQVVGVMEVVEVVECLRPGILSLLLVYSTGVSNRMGRWQ